MIEGSAHRVILPSVIEKLSVVSGQLSVAWNVRKSKAREAKGESLDVLGNSVDFRQDDYEAGSVGRLPLHMTDFSTIDLHPTTI